MILADIVDFYFNLIMLFAFTDIVDFAPLCLDSAPSLIRLPKFEPLTNTIQRAQSWIIQQQVSIKLSLFYKQFNMDYII